MTRSRRGGKSGGEGPSGAGRAGLRLGFDIGGTKVAVALGEGDRLLAHRRVPFPATGDPREDLERITDAARGLLAGAGRSARQIEALGISAPGPLDPEAGVIHNPPNLPGWRDVPLTEWLGQSFDVPVALENDADAAALAEWRFGAARGARHAVYLTMSTGVGGGLVLGGRLHRGQGSAGEIGHAPIEWEGEPCVCGLRGCLEAYIGGAAWTRRLRKVAPEDGAVAEMAGGREAVSPAHVLAAARERDAFALEELARWNGYLARGIVWLTMVLQPEVVVLGTIATAAGEELCFAPVREAVAAHVWQREGIVPRIVPSELGDLLGEYAALAAAPEPAGPPR